MAAGATNPFSNNEKENFPNFDAVFESDKATPSTDTNQKRVFRWSIDQMARLKPIDIGTSPSSLAHHVMSPCDDPRCQEESDKFFSQKLIHPSPWLQAKTQSAKHVTFSPHPPETTYFKKDESANMQADASTQTTLSIPLDFDLERMLGSAFQETTYSFNLRRKLFGEPLRQDGEEEEGDDGCYGSSPSPFNDGASSSNETFQDTQLSSTPLRSPFTPTDILNRDSCHGDMITSSFVIANNEALPLLSPINNDLQTPQKAAIPPDSLLELSPITEQSDINTALSENGLKPILKRHYHGSPHWPEVKHYCNYRPEQLSEDDKDINSSGSSSSEGGGREGVTPSILSLADLNTYQEMTTSSAATLSTGCTTYFNNLELIDEGEDKPVHSLVSSWQPPINSTMIKHSVAPPITDSGYGTTVNNNDIRMLSFDKPTIPDETGCDSVCCSRDLGERTCNDDKIQSAACKSLFTRNLLPSRFKPSPSNLTPPSRYNIAGVDPIAKDLIRRKNVLKAKLSVVNLEKF